MSTAAHALTVYKQGCVQEGHVTRVEVRKQSFYMSLVKNIHFTPFFFLNLNFDICIDMFSLFITITRPLRLAAFKAGAWLLNSQYGRSC